MEMMGALVWDSKNGEGGVFLSPEFFENNRVVQLDAIVDWIGCLQSTYDEMLRKAQ